MRNSWRGSRSLGWITFIAITAISILRAPLSESLWLDETISAWISSGTPFQAAYRSVAFQGQSPLYFLLLWGWRQLFGGSEVVLRSFSLVCTLLSLLTLHRISRQLKISEVTGFVFLAFVTIEEILRASFGVRPYALALLFVLLAISSLIEWLEETRLRALLGTILFTILSFYSHYLFGLVIAVQVAFVIAYRWKKVWEILPAMILALGIGVIICLPGSYHLGYLHDHRDVVGFLSVPGWRDLFSAILPRQYWVYLPFSTVLGAIFGSLRVRPGGFDASGRKLLFPLVIWWLLPGMFFFVASHLLDVSLFTDRYFLWRGGGIVLLLGMLLSSLKDSRTRLIVIGSWFLFSLFVELNRYWNVEDWRGASQYAARFADEVPLLVYSGLAEVENLDWSESAERERYVTSPLQVYQTSHPLVVVPGNWETEKAGRYFRETIEPVLQNNPKIAFIGFGGMKMGNERVVDQIARRIESLGFRKDPSEAFGLVEVISFSRSD